MVTNQLLLWQLKRVFTLYAYYLTYGIRAHRLIRDIDVWLVGCGDIFAFEAIAEKAHKRDPATDAPPLIHFLGGSSYGAFQDLEEMRIWIKAFVEGLALQTAIVALHLGMSGRCDFHVLSPNLMADGRALYHADLREKARALARELTTQLNERRLRLGLLPIGNLTPDGEVFFLDPRLELVTPPPIGQEPQVTETIRLAEQAPPVPKVPPSLAKEVKKEGDTDRVEPTPAPAEAPPPRKPAPAATLGFDHPQTRERDLAAIAAAAKAERERQEAKKKREREEEAAARARAQKSEFDRFLKQLLLLGCEAESHTQKIHARGHDLRSQNPGAIAADPRLTKLLEESQRFQNDATTRAALDTAIAVQAGDRPELRSLKQRCQDAQVQAQSAYSELSKTVAAITAVREHASLEVDEDRRERGELER